MRRALFVVVLAGLAGCPQRKVPERGIELVFAKSGDVRLAVERRLARLGVKARLSEDETSLTVRLPKTGAPVDVAAVKALLSVPAKLEFCKEAPQPPRAHCDAPPPADGGAPGPAVERVPDDFDEAHCMVLGREPAALHAAVDAGAHARVMVGTGRDDRLRTYVAEPDCLVPRVLRAEAQPGALPLVNVVFDGPSAEQFSALTTATVQRRLLIVLDGVVTAAPVVQTPITGGRAMVTLGPGTNPAQAVTLAAALESGVIEGGLSLAREGAYGPPSLAP